MALLIILFVILAHVGVIGITVYGIYLSFKKKWYFGVIGLAIPVFGFIVGLGKLFKKDLLK